jgi:hypothetical protein
MYDELFRHAFQILEGILSLTKESHTHRKVCRNVPLPVS